MAAEGPGPTAPRRPLLAPEPVAPAQIVAGVLGIVLVVVGLAGLAVNSSFHTGARMTSDRFLGFAVNGWDDVILGVLFGLILLLGARARGSARAACRLVGIGYLVVFFAGLGRDAFGWVPANTADEVLRIVLALVLLAAAHASKEKRDAVARARVVLDEDDAGSRIVGPGSGHVGGPRATQPRIDRRLPQKTHP